MTQTPENRTFGAGAAGDLPDVSAHTAGPTRKQRWLYRFDNSLFRSPTSFLWWLVAGTAAANGLLTLVWVIVQPVEGQSAVDGYFGMFFQSFNTIFFGNGPSMATWVDRVMAMGSWLISTAITATVIAIATTMIGERMADLKRGKSSVLEANHTLILGWSSRIFPILDQVAQANSNVANPVVVIFADVDRETMEREITARVGSLGSTTLVTRSGDPTNPRDLARAAVDKARVIIVLDSEDGSDAAIVTTVLAVRAVAPDSSANIIVEIDDYEHASALAHATAGQVIAVQSQDVIARVTAQATRQPGLATVILDLLDFEGDEIYIAEVPDLVSRTYGDAVTAFEKAAVIGLQLPDGTVMLNPDMKRRVLPGESVIAIAEDDDRVIFTGFRDDLAMVQAKRAAGTGVKIAEHLLVIGWSPMGRSVLNELGEFLPIGSTVHVLANPELVDTSALAELKFGNAPVTFTPHTGGVDQIAKAASARKFDEIIVLGYRDTVTVAEADSHTMMTMMLLNRLFDEEGNGVEPTRLVAEILDSRKSELARIAAADDLVVSDNLAALMIAMVSENASLKPVIDDLFDAEGASINVRPIESYADANQPVPFAELVAAARSRGESAVGYRIAALAKSEAAGGVRLNPAKSTVFQAAHGDGLVVIGPADN